MVPCAQGLPLFSEASTNEMYFAGPRAPSYVTTTLVACGSLFVAALELVIVLVGDPYLIPDTADAAVKVSRMPESDHVESVLVPEFSA